jgi:3-oxoacyl-[acyl-carrier-protein] synthase-3
MRYASIVSTSSFVPSIELTNHALRVRFEGNADALDKLAKMEDSTGIKTRFYAPDDWATSDLATRAGRLALERAGVDASEVDLILVGTDSPDYVTPSTSVIVQRKLGAKRAGTFDVGCACASFPTALAAGASLLATNASLKNVLVIGAYMMHKLADPLDTTIFLYGDGAGAAVLRASDRPGVLGAAFGANGDYAERWGIFSGGTAEPASVRSIEEGRTKVRMREGYPREVNEEGWPDLARRLSADCGFQLGDVDVFVFTQVRKRTIERVMATLGQPLERAHMIMDKWGYTGSACIPMALDDARQAGKLPPGSLALLIGSGVGYNQAGAAVRFL